MPCCYSTHLEGAISHDPTTWMTDQPAFPLNIIYFTVFKGQMTKSIKGKHREFVYHRFGGYVELINTLVLFCFGALNALLWRQISPLSTHV